MVRHVDTMVFLFKTLIKSASVIIKIIIKRLQMPMYGHLQGIVDKVINETENYFLVTKQRKYMCLQFFISMFLLIASCFESIFKVNHTIQ